jgi:hypothetical protein
MPASNDSKPTTKPEDLKVFISLRDSKCDECGEELGRKAWITLEENKGALCLACADLDELVFLPTGDAALTRRARKHSVLSAVVLKFSQARGRYERQGLLVEENALAQAEAECRGPTASCATSKRTSSGTGPLLCERVCRTHPPTLP